MRILLACLLALFVLTASTPTWAGDEDKKVQRWYERLQKELADLERRVEKLDGSSAPAALDDKDKRAMARLLLQMTNRMMELEKRIAALEKGNGAKGATPAADTPVEDPQVAAKDGGAAEGKDAKGLPAFLNDPKIADKIPEPPKDSKVNIVKAKSGLKKAVVSMPEGVARGPFGRMGCTPGAELFLVQDAPVFGMSLVLVNKTGYRFKDEKYVYIVIDGNTTKTAMKWQGSKITTDEGVVLYVETIHFGTGLPNFLSLIDGARVRILLGATEFVLERLCLATLRDLCSCLHPDRIQSLR